MQITKMYDLGKINLQQKMAGFWNGIRAQDSWNDNLSADDSTMAQCPLCVPAHSRQMVQLASQGQQGRILGSGSVAQVILLYS